MSDKRPTDIVVAHYHFAANKCKLDFTNATPLDVRAFAKTKMNSAELIDACSREVISWCTLVGLFTAFRIL